MKNPEFTLAQIENFISKNYNSVSARYVKAMYEHYKNHNLPDLPFEHAEQLSQTCDYALLAVQPEGIEINWGDAASFFLEGYEHARKELK